MTVLDGTSILESCSIWDNKLATILNLDQRRSHRLDTNQRSLESELQQISKLPSDSSSFQRPTEQTDFTEMVGVWKDNSQRSSSSFDPISEGVQQLGVSEVRKPDSTTRNSVNKPPMVKSIDAASGMFDCSHLNVSTGDEKFKSPNDDAWQAATQPTMHVPIDSRSSLLSDPLANRELKSQSDRLTVVCRKSSRSGCSTLDITEAKPEDKLSVLEATQSGLHPLAGVKWRQSDKKTVDSALRTGYSDQSYDFSVPTDLITAEAHWIHPNDLGMARKHVNMESEMNSSSSWTEVGTQTVESYTFHQEAIKRHSILDSKDGDGDENEFANVCNTANIAHTRKHSEHHDEGKYVHTRSGFATQNVSWNKSMQFDWMMDKAIQTDAYSKEIVIRRRQGILSSEQNLQQQMMEAKQQDTQNTSQEQLNSRSVTSSMKSASDSIIEPVTSVATTRSTCCRYLLPLLALLLSLLLLFLLLLCLFSKSTCTGINHSSDDCVEQTMLWRFLYRPLHTVRFRGVPI
ncbi:hypothetical protein AHF37_09803 [Paragonimus kellicotti]|nr:hypothetical protein AHF37_09803 [Paragonimus kellicotti]